MYTALYRYQTGAGYAYNVFELHVTPDPSLLEKEIQGDVENSGVYDCTRDVKLAALKTLDEPQTQGFLEEMARKYDGTLRRFRGERKGVTYPTSQSLVFFDCKQGSNAVKMILNEGLFVNPNFLPNLVGHWRFFDPI